MLYHSIGPKKKKRKYVKYQMMKTKKMAQESPKQRTDNSREI